MILPTFSTFPPYAGGAVAHRPRSASGHPFLATLAGDLPWHNRAESWRDRYSQVEEETLIYYMALPPHTAHRGFTFVEVLIVFAIIAVLAIQAAPAVSAITHA